jgi:DNA-binding transcriptional LysR family regulator
MNLPNVTLRQLRAFVIVADAGSFASASRLLHLTPSALSLLVKELELVMKVRLFDRTTRSNVLSAAGTEFLPLARHLLEDLSRAVESTRDLEQKRRGTVRIACTPLYASMLLPRLVRGYRERYPAIAVEVLDSLHDQAMQRVTTGEVDFGIAPQRRVTKALNQQPLLADRLWLVCPADHPFAARRVVTWRQVLQQPFVSLTADFTTQLQSDLLRHDADLLLHPASQVSFLLTALGMVQSGLGVTVQPAHALPLLEPFGLVARRVVQPTVYRQLSLFFRAGRELSPAATSFCEFARGATGA